MTAPFQQRDAEPNPGGAPVSTLRTIGPMQAMAVMMMRDGLACPGGPARVRATFEETLGPVAGTAAADCWTQFAGALLTHSRRPLMCHALTCACVGADEAVVAQMLHLAATGVREDAMLILMLLVPPDRALCVLPLAEAAGLAVMRAARVAARPTGAPLPTYH